MPELPEVEIVRQSLLKNIKGKKINKVLIRNRNLRFKLETSFEKKLKNKFIKDLLFTTITEGTSMSLDNEWRNFLLNEELDEKSIFTYIQGLQEIISNLKPRTVSEKRRLQLAKQHIREVRKYARRMLNENMNLQDKLNLLEESKED